MKLSIRNILKAADELGYDSIPTEQLIKKAKELQNQETVNVRTREIEYNKVAGDLVSASEEPK